MRHAAVALVLVLAALAEAGEPPAEAFRVGPPAVTGPRITPYLAAQLERAWSQDAGRLQRFAGVRSAADVAPLQAELRAKLLASIGGLPEDRTPLQPRVVGSVARLGYRIEKIVFESLPRVPVTALLYVPDAPAGRKPAVLLPCGHAPEGKAFRNYQEIAGQLARRGYVVLSWDPVGQGERSQFWDAARGRSRYNLVCGEHAVLGNLALLAGLSLNRYEVWDGMRALDYLLTRPEVDAARVAITGTSGGGLQSAWIGALDPRIAVVMPSCFTTALPMRMANRIFEDPDSDPEQDPPGLVSEGVDHAGLLALVHPRPLLIAAAAKDFVPIEGARRTYRELRALYAASGQEDRVALAEGYHGHMYSPENRLAAFAFLDRAFGRTPAPALDAIEVLDPAELRCTRSGQAALDLDARPLLDVVREEHAKRASPMRPLSAVYDESKPREQPASAERTGSSEHDGVRIDRYALRRGSRVVPLLHFSKPGRRAARARIDLSLDGKLGPAEWPRVVQAVSAGEDVVSFDLPGVGEDRMLYKAESIDDPGLAAADETAAYFSPVSGVLANHVYNSLLLGRPYLLEMLDDVESVVAFSRQGLGLRDVALASRGDAALLADAAAAVFGVPMADGKRAPGKDWAAALREGAELYPIQYLLPGGASVSLRPEAR
jgi:hypothetical protein